jgi:hypothetical protein
LIDIVTRNLWYSQAKLLPNEPRLAKDKILKNRVCQAPQYYTPITYQLILDATIHAYGRSEGICGIIISDMEYPSLVAHQVLSKLVDEFLAEYTVASISKGGKLAFPKLKDYITKYQDPQQADSIMKIQKELDETKILMKKTIESVLERGEKIDTLVQKSDGLSSQSKMFYTQVGLPASSRYYELANIQCRQESKTLAASLCKLPFNNQLRHVKLNLRASK